MSKSVIIIFLFLLLLTIFSCEKSKDPFSPSAAGHWRPVATINAGQIVSPYYSGLNEIFFVDSQHGWVVGDNGQIKHSKDGGSTWENQNSGTDSKLYSVFFIDYNKGFVAGNNNTLLTTKDGGFTWKTVLVNSDSSTIFSSLHADRDGNIWFISNYGDIFCSTDEGETWERRVNLDQWGYSYLYFYNKSIGFSMRSAGNEVKKTTNGGLSWRTFSFPSNFTGDICFIDERHGWFIEGFPLDAMMHDTFSLYYTDNGGESWQKRSTFSDYNLQKIVFIDQNNGWLTQANKIFHTNDGGFSWSLELVTGVENYVRDLCVKNVMLGWALTSNGTIFKYSGS